MTGEKIQLLIHEKEKKIEEIQKIDIFTLNEEIAQLQIQIKQLQDQCPHSFDKFSNKCEFCGKERKQ